MSFLVTICDDLFLVLSDTLHKSGFKHQVDILLHIVYAIESKQLVMPINSACPDNKVYFKEYLTTLLSSKFQNVTKVKAGEFVDVMFRTCGNKEQFKTTVRDFLISMKEFAQNNEMLFADERQVLGGRDNVCRNNRMRPDVWRR